MEESLPQQLDQQLYLSQGIKFKNQYTNAPPFKFSRQRSVSPLPIKDRIQSPHTKNVKAKHLMYKKDLLQEKFQNLQLNNKQEKKPLKLKLDRINKQNMTVLKQLGQISNGLQIKFEAQNSLIRRSLQKIQRIVTKSIPQKSLQRVQSLSRIGQKPKLQLGPTQNEKNLQARLEKEISQKIKLQEELKGIKNINQFLVNQNYKLSMEVTMLKQKILDYEQKDYEDALRSVKSVSSEGSESDKDENQQNSFLIQKNQQKSEVLNKRQSEKQKQSNQNVVKEKLISQKSLQLQKQSQSLLRTPNSKQRKQSVNSKQQEIVEQCQQCKKNVSISQEIIRLIGQINKLQEELEHEKILNESLSNRVSALKKQLSEGTSVQKRNQQDQVDEKIDTAISINMEIKKNQQQNQASGPDEIYSQNQDEVQQMEEMKSSIPSSYPHKATKSHISNQIIYFAEPIAVDIDRTIPRSSKSIYQQQQNIRKSLSINVIQPNQLQKEDQIYVTRSIKERQKTPHIKKLEVPDSNEEKFRRNSTDKEKRNSSIQSKTISLGNNSLSFYSNQKINLLQTIRQTISLKFEAFKYTFGLFQNQMIMWPNGKLTVKEVKSILTEYPFFLDDSSIQALLGYCGAVEGKNIKVDKFCNKLKEFIEDYPEMSEEEEMILEKKIYKRWKYTKDEILDVMKKFQSTPGQISKYKFVAILEEFKFEQKEIHHLLSQSVAISSDIHHIKYRQYLANFLTKK